MNEKVIREIPDASDIHLARARIHSQVRQTPVVNDPGLDQVLGCKLYLKLENLQRMGAFKFRGASNAVLKMVEDGHQGDVATHSSGNHGAALALAASLAGRGVDVALIERHDFAAETSSNSSNLVWGGIKYMEGYEFGLVAGLCKSRNELLDSFPSTVKESIPAALALSA